MIEVGRRRFLTGLFSVGGLVAAPAVIRVAPLMPISARFTPAYVPMLWLSEGWRGSISWPRAELKNHSWPRPMGPHWINLNDYDADYVRTWVKRLEQQFDDDDIGRRRRWS